MTFSSCDDPGDRVGRVPPRPRRVADLAALAGGEGFAALGRSTDPEGQTSGCRGPDVWLSGNRRGARERGVTAEKLNVLSEAIIGAAIAVRRELGPGHLSLVYGACLAYELRERGFLVECQRLQSLRYKRLTVDGAYRVDLVVQDGSGAEVFVELKAIDKLLPVHEAQLLTHLKLSGRELGLLMNFNVELLKDGIRRLVNGFPD